MNLVIHASLDIRNYELKFLGTVTSRGFWLNQFKTNFKIKKEILLFPLSIFLRSFHDTGTNSLRTGHHRHRHARTSISLGPVGSGPYRHSNILCRYLTFGIDTDQTDGPEKT